MPDAPAGADLSGEPGEDQALRIAVSFAGVLRHAGLDVPVGATLEFARSLAVVGFESESGVYWSGRATLVRRPEDIGTYDGAFAAFFRNRPAVEVATSEPLRVLLVTDDADSAPAPSEVETPDVDATLAIRYSPVEILRERDFAAYTPDEHAQARKLMGDLRFVGATRRSRRRRAAPRRGSEPDVRRTIRAAIRAGGEPIRRRYRRASEQPRRLVLMLDVSGSMEPYSRALVRFVHAAVVARGRVEAFAFGTRLTRITRELKSRDPDAAIAEATRRVQDWSGGTRLGESLHAFLDTWGMRGMARGAVIVILSDGWDRGDPDVVDEQMQRLARVAHRIVWVNPLKASEGYAPLARGMAAALPYVDDFVEGNSLAALEDLAGVLA